MSRLTGDAKYRNAAIEALHYQRHKAVDLHGFPAMGGHRRWNLFEDRIKANSA